MLKSDVSLQQLYFLNNSKKLQIMATITEKQIDNLLIIAGNICGLEEALQKAIDSKNSEQIQHVQCYLTVVRERLISAINDIDR